MPLLIFNNSYYLCDCCFLSPPADPSECSPLTASGPSTSGSPAYKRKYQTDGKTTLSLDSQGLATDPIPGPVVTGPVALGPGPAGPGSKPLAPSPVALGPGPVGPGPRPVALGPGPVRLGPGPGRSWILGPGLRIGAGLDLLHHSGGAEGPAGVGSKEDLMGQEEGRTREDAGPHMDVEDEDQKESKRKEKLYKIVTELLMTEQAYVARLHLLDQVWFRKHLVSSKPSLRLSSLPFLVHKKIRNQACLMVTDMLPCHR